MNQSTIDYIKDICSRDLTKESDMTKAQVMLKNINFFRDYGAKAGYDGNIPFEALEGALKKMVKKYDVLIGQILAITDIDGSVTWHGGMYYTDRVGQNSKSVWLFTIHSQNLYEYMVKLVLMSFLSIKTSDKIRGRDPEAAKETMRRYN